VRRKSPEIDEIEVIVVGMEGGKPSVLNLGPYKTNVTAQQIIAKFGAPNYFDSHTAAWIWVPDIGELRKILGIK
jgi:hypothetical protein